MKSTEWMTSYQIRVCKPVRKCIDKDIIKDHFIVQSHGKHTGNASKSLKVPKTRTEYARKSFSYTGKKIYNDLPLKIRTANVTEYEKNL